VSLDTGYPLLATGHWPLATGWVGGIPPRWDGGLLYGGLHCGQCQYQEPVFLPSRACCAWRVRKNRAPGGMAIKDENLTNCTRRKMVAGTAMAVAW